MKIIIGGDLKTLLTESYLLNMAESHLDCWKDRYYRKSKADLKFDLSVNHDDSLEIDSVSEDLEREINDKERNYIIDKFHKKVVSIFY
jgi:hypothetical protein